MSHTNGPWEVSGQLIVGPPESLPNPKAEPRGKVVASICWDYLGNHGATEPRIKWKGEGEANACLISAAPCLLEICQEIAAEPGINLLDSERRIRLYAAITKATGGAV